ncbi:MAG TPA: hypothetical protein VEA16_16200 [Vicinamibacterales bacterium]|nr:hypothetical protein [Vicinamibacterales bacterium]
MSALQSSVLLAAAAAVVQVVWRAAAQSRSARSAAALRQRWDGLGVDAQRTAIGMALVMAGLTNVAVTAASDHPAGWLWIAPPAIAASIGAVLLASSTSPRGRE